MGNCHLWHVSIPWHRSVSGLWPPWERLPDGAARGMSSQSIWTHESMWVAAILPTSLYEHKQSLTACVGKSLVCPYVCHICVMSQCTTSFTFHSYTVPSFCLSHYQAGSGAHWTGRHLQRSTKHLKRCSMTPASLKVQFEKLKTCFYKAFKIAVLIRLNRQTGSHSEVCSVKFL